MQNLTISIALLLSIGAVWAQEESMQEATVTFSKEPNQHTVWGFGGEWDPHFWLPQNTRRGCNEDAWQRVTGKIRDMG